MVAGYRFCEIARMMSSMGSQPNLVNNITELFCKLTSTITLAQRFCSRNNLFNCYFEQLPHIVQQYARTSFIRELYSNREHQVQGEGNQSLFFRLP